MTQTAGSIKVSEHGTVNMSEHNETLKNTLDILSVIATIGSFLQVFTPIFGLIGAIWTLMRIAEMITGKPFAEIIKRKKYDAK
jgi:hypothetical protein